jgi:esterase/lipase
MRHSLLLFFGLIAMALAAPSAGEKGEIGVVLLHGKQGAVPGRLGPLARKLKAAGCLVATPEMPWSRGRIYAASYEDALLEIDQAVEGLKEKGAQRIVVGGLSLGGNAAVGYAARRQDLAGIIVLAPGQFPESPNWRERFASSVARAREMVAAGKGDSMERFEDLNMGKTFYSQATAKNYLSYFDPEGPAVLPTNAAAIRRAIPILWVVGTRDPATRPSGYAFDKAPPHPKSKYLAVDADHLGVPAAAADVILEWLRNLDR